MANFIVVRTLGLRFLFFLTILFVQQDLRAAAQGCRQSTLEGPFIWDSAKPFLWSCEDAVSGKQIMMPIAKLVPQKPNLSNKSSVRFKTHEDQRIYYCTEQLLDALKQNQPERCKQLLTEGADPRLCIPCFGESPIVLAAKHAMTDVIRLLIEHKADVHAGGNYLLYEPDTVLCAVLRLFVAVTPHCGYTHVRTMLNMLVDAGADPMQKGLYAEEPLVVIAKAHGIPNSIAFPIMHDLLQRCLEHDNVMEMRAKAVKKAEEMKQRGCCRKHTAMFHARAYFVEHYPGRNERQKTLFAALIRASSDIATEKEDALQEIEAYRVASDAAAQKELKELLRDCLGCSMSKPWQPTIDLDNPLFDWPLNKNDLIYINKNNLIHREN